MTYFESNKMQKELFEIEEESNDFKLEQEDKFENYYHLDMQQLINKEN